MKRFARSLCIAVVAISSATLAAQPLKSTAERLREDPDRAAAVHHSYEYVATPDTPAPAGYTPFYVSHYGRHGSRRSLGSNATAAFEYLTKAKEADCRTALRPRTGSLRAANGGGCAVEQHPALPDQHGQLYR